MKWIIRLGGYRLQVKISKFANEVESFKKQYFVSVHIASNGHEFINNLWNESFRWLMEQWPSG